MFPSSLFAGKWDGQYEGKFIMSNYSCYRHSTSGPSINAQIFSDPITVTPTVKDNALAATIRNSECPRFKKRSEEKWMVMATWNSPEM